MNYFLRTLRLAFVALRRNVMRSALTTLGIMIGVAAVIAMSEIGQGSSVAIQKRIESMGANNILIMPGAPTSGGVSFGSGGVMTLTPEDGKALMRDCSGIVNVAPVIRARTQVIYGNRNWVPLYIYGTTPEFLDVRDWTELSAGEVFTERDVLNSSKVCLIGQTLADQLFGEEAPVGKDLRVQNVTFRVVGVLSRKGANMMGIDQDDILLAPWTTIKYRVNGSSLGNVNQSSSAGSAALSPTSTTTTATSTNSLSQLYPNLSPTIYPTVTATQQADRPQPVRFTNIDQLLVQAGSPEEVSLAITQIRELLRERHHIKAGQEEDFQVRDMAEMTSALASTTSLMTTLLLVVATISLIVGGVGIMNIMLVSVTERTKEIGLRMAVGARARDILRQFLVEAILLCVLGGLIGILLGVGSSWVLRTFWRWPTQASPGAIIAAVAVSGLVGIAFGYYPAWKASRLDPIEALRYE